MGSFLNRPRIVFNRKSIIPLTVMTLVITAGISFLFDEVLGHFYLLAGIFIIGLLALMIHTRNLMLLNPIMGLILTMTYILCIIFFFGVIYKETGGIVDLNGALTDALGDCVYFSVVTWTTLGYGDFRPTDPQRIIVGTEAIMGHISLAVFVAYLMTVIRPRENSGIPRV